MKKVILFFACVLIAVTAIASDRVVYNDSPLPTTAKEVIVKNFKSKVNFVKIDKNAFGKTDYEVILKNGTEIEFDGNGNLKSVDAGQNGVPKSLIPEAIQKYVKQHFKNKKIYELDIEKKSYKVELSDGTELRFDKGGKFISQKR